MNAVLHDVSRDQLIARHKANSIQVVYALSAAKAAMFAGMGIEVHICGNVKVG